MNYLDIDTKYTPEKLMKLGYEKNFIEKIRSVIKKNQFKRRMPEVLKIPWDKIKSGL
jgi:NH3-dependent NAD+ synthetase